VPIEESEMFLAGRAAWAAIVFTFLTTGISGPRAKPLASGASLSRKVPAVEHRNEIKNLQETLRNKGHYRGKVDGVFGLRTRASIRAYQKAENFPISGEVDGWTADGLGIRPESIWNNCRGDGGVVGRGADRAGGDINRGKPSAGIRRVEGRASKTKRTTVSRTIPTEDTRGEDANKQQAENEKHEP
jgi:peptidoglycan hydrolase-like protein with peptidoglycan-binding domain